MTIDDAIKHAEEVAEENNKCAEHIRDKMKSEIALSNAIKCETCAKEQRQFAVWLKELKSHREAWTVVANAMKECSYKIWHEFGEYIGEDCEQLEIVNLKTALDILEDYRPKEGRLKELQTDISNLTSQSLSDLLVHCENENERLHDRTNELEKELQAHREAWERVTGIINKWKDGVGGVVVAKDAFSDILDLITNFRPKEGDAE